ncbi:MAG: hypothetical protein IPH00_07440 [Flavobacteriales bacterium]|nr:hypothetical protein [Flavobacteriales bacterium]
MDSTSCRCPASHFSVLSPLQSSRRRISEQLYVVEAQANEESIPGLIQGLLKRKHRGRLANGILIDRLNFYGCAAIQTQETIANTPGWKVGPFN